jgi:hypothetical protein
MGRLLPRVQRTYDISAASSDLPVCGVRSGGTHNLVNERMTRFDIADQQPRPWVPGVGRAHRGRSQDALDSPLRPGSGATAGPLTAVAASLWARTMIRRQSSIGPRTGSSSSLRAHRMSTVTSASHVISRSLSGSPGRRILARRLLPPWCAAGRGQDFPFEFLVSETIGPPGSPSVASRQSPRRRPVPFPTSRAVGVASWPAAHSMT